ncbi:MAG: hypothetical protein H7255_11280 [Ramlibacter sp.]|nr:hypothetical protein [Ramlibacter sp.]
MTGLFLLLVATLWFVLATAIAYAIVRRTKHVLSRFAVALAAFFILFPLPLIDELTAKPHFEALCQEQAVLVLDNPGIQPRTVWFDAGVRTHFPIGLLDSTVYRKQYVEMATGRPVYHYSTVTATGGWLVRILKISESNSPLTFRSTCAPPELSNLRVWLRDHGITELPRPISN